MINNIRDELLSTLKSKFPKYDNYFIESYDSSLYVYNNLSYIIKESRKDQLFSIRDILLKIINVLSDYEFKNRSLYESYCQVYNLRLNIIKCRMNNEPIQTYLHEYIGLRHLLSLGYNSYDIIQQINDKDGIPDYKTIDGNEWEIKIIIGNKIVFTRLQIEKFKEDANILIYRRNDYGLSPNEKLKYVGCKFSDQIKFGDILNKDINKKYLKYNFSVCDSPENFYHILNIRRRYMR